jgi:arylsulfatase A-like enzyme
LQLAASEAARTKEIGVECLEIRTTADNDSLYPPPVHSGLEVFGTVDIAGHDYGWMSEGYLAQLEWVDRIFGRFAEALPPETTLLVQSDHGGHDRHHGTDSPEDMTIPWLIAGPDIKAGYEIQSKVSLLDTAPTLARLLSLKPHPDWEGRCVEEIFENK